MPLLRFRRIDTGMYATNLFDMVSRGIAFWLCASRRNLPPPGRAVPEPIGSDPSRPGSSRLFPLRAFGTEQLSYQFYTSPEDTVVGANAVSADTNKAGVKREETRVGGIGRHQKGVVGQAVPASRFFYACRRLPSPAESENTAKVRVLWSHL